MRCQAWASACCGTQAGHPSGRCVSTAQDLLGLPPIHTTSCSPADLHVFWVTHLSEAILLAVAAQDILQGKNVCRSLLNQRGTGAGVNHAQFGDDKRNAPRGDIVATVSYEQARAMIAQVRESLQLKRHLRSSSASHSDSIVELIHPANLGLHFTAICGGNESLTEEHVPAGYGGLHCCAPRAWRHTSRMHSRGATFDAFGCQHCLLCDSLLSSAWWGSIM